MVGAPPALSYYRREAATYADENPDLPIRRHVEWPAVRSLLPDLEGAHVLDAGCGDGSFTAEFAAMGADVVGIDAARPLLERATETTDDSTTWCHVDLRAPLPFEDDTFDVVVSQLVLDHIEAWTPVLGEFERVLTPAGTAVISVGYPPAVWVKIDRDEEIDPDAPSYFETEPWFVSWPGGPVRKYRRPQTDQLGAAFEAGFVLDGLREAEPPEALADRDPERYRRWVRRPAMFVAYRLRPADGR